MPIPQHTPECIASSEKRFQEIESYEKQYPNHCRKCKGAGGIYSTYDSSPSGVSLSLGYMHDFEPCQHCFEQAICPQCAKPIKEADDEGYHITAEKCDACGWDSEKPNGKPEPSECFCYDEFADVDFSTLRDAQRINDFYGNICNSQTKYFDRFQANRTVEPLPFTPRPLEDSRFIKWLNKLSDRIATLEGNSLYVYILFPCVIMVYPNSTRWEIQPHSYLGSKTTWKHGNAYLGKIRIIW